MSDKEIALEILKLLFGKTKPDALFKVAVQDAVDAYKTILDAVQRSGLPKE